MPAERLCSFGMVEIFVPIYGWTLENALIFSRSFKKEKEKEEKKERKKKS